MRKFINTLIVVVFVAFGQSAIQAQTAGSIGGTVVDQNGAVVPNATVTVKGESGQEFTAVTSDNGTYKIPAVANGLYTVTVSTTTGFKTFVVTNVKVDVGSPTTVDAALEIGGQEQIVEVTSGGEVLQTQTATVGTNIQGRQITETPIASRNALDLVNLLPGTATVGRPRASSINGLPKGSLTITVDGVDVQDNVLKSSDGYFTFVQPKVDAIEEVTVSTANPGAESSGEGAVQIKFATKRGTNDYRGGLFYQNRNTALNSAYFYNNRDLKPLPGDTKAPRDKINLNQYGGRLGGPIPFPHIGEGGPFFHSGKDTAFFFVNYEEYRLPQSLGRTRTVLQPQAQAGIFSYIVGAETRMVDLFDLARRNNQLATPDPTVGALLARIRASTGTTGSFTPITGDPNRVFYNFTPSGLAVRKFTTVRLDFNLNKNNSVEFVTNRQNFLPAKDFLNGVEERFPGFPSYGQGGIRKSYTAALRSTLTNSIVNEARFSHSGGTTVFFPELSQDDFAFQGGVDLGIGAAGITSGTTLTGNQSRSTPTYDFTDSMTVIRGNHTINFGGQYKLIKSTSSNQRFVPSIGFGLDSTDTAAFNMFSGGDTGTLRGASAAQLAEARALYATLIGRVISYTNTAVLTAEGTNALNANQTTLTREKTYGVFGQDNWRISPSLSINYGLRWQPLLAYTIDSANVSKLSSYDQIFGVSGLNNIFKPGTLTGTAPTATLYKKGEKAFSNDLNNFAPSFGIVYSPNFSGKGILNSILGESGRSVFRGGYSVSYVREGISLFSTITGNLPGGQTLANRNLGIPGTFTVGTNLRDPNNANLTAPAFPVTPTFPLALTAANQALAFAPDLRTGSVQSFSAGYQREIDKNTVIEFRYVGNRGRDLQRLNFINEFNTIENGFANEFGLAQANLYANEAAFAAGQTNRRFCPASVDPSTGACFTTVGGQRVNVARTATFAFFGAGTGTSPLPIIQSYFSTPNNPLTPTIITFNPSNPALYLNGNFANSTLVSQLSVNAPNVIGFGSSTSFEANAVRRANAIANGLPSNFFRVNPTVPNGAFVLENTGKTWYDSGVVELRRRLSAGLRFQASYVFAKAQSNSFQSASTAQANYSLRPNGLELAKNVAPFDIRHNFKFDATFDLPFGKGQAFFGNANGLLNSIVGGFTILPTLRWQSGSPFSIGNVTLVGMTKQELQKEIKLRKDSIQNGVNVVTFLPDDIILNTQRAFDVNPTTATGYGTQFGGGGAPTGRFIAPAGFGNCQSRFNGECGFNNLVLYGPSFFKFDVSVAKKIKFDEKRNFEIRATFLDALNHPNFRVGGWAADVVSIGAGGSTFGQLGFGSAYQDISTTNDPGGRLVDVMLRLNF